MDDRTSPTPGEQPDEGLRWLRPVLGWSLGLSLVFIAVEVEGRFRTGDPLASRALALLGAFAVTELAAWLAAMRGRSALAATVFAWALLAISLGTTTLTTFITPPLMLLPLFGMAVALPFLRGASLVALLIGACL